MDAKQIAEGSLSAGSTTMAFSDNFILTIGGILNIQNNLNEDDCKKIIVANRLKQIQFTKKFTISVKTFELINRFFLDTKNFYPSIKLELGDSGIVDNLACLEYLPNLKSLTVNMYKNNQINIVNKYLKLQKLAIGGDGISIKELLEQNQLNELFVFDKLKDIEIIGKMNSLEKLTISKIPFKNLEFLVGLDKLKELHFMLGSAANYEKLPDIGQIEKLSFTLVKKLSETDLEPVNEMKYLKHLRFDSQGNITNLDWLKNKKIEVQIINCKNFRG